MLSSRQISWALLLGVGVAVGILFWSDTTSTSAVRSGDFPAFYTLAVIANSVDPGRLYDQDLQRSIQSLLWGNRLQLSYLPAAYPPFVAFLIKPLTWLGVDGGRIVWFLLSILCGVLTACRISSYNKSLTTRRIESVAALFLFAPFLVGSLGGQVVAVSGLLYVTIVYLARELSQQPRRSTEFLLGLTVGAWFFKPQYAVVAMLPLFAARKWIALIGVILFAAVYYFLGCLVLGVWWPFQWMAVAREFAEMNFASNSYQMTNLMGALRHVAMLGVGIGPVGYWAQVASVICICLIGTWAYRARVNGESFVRAFVLLGPLVALATPQSNFYDLGLTAVSLLLVSDLSLVRERWRVGIVWLLGASLTWVRSPQQPPFFFAFAVLMTVAVMRGLQNLHGHQGQEDRTNF